MSLPSNAPLSMSQVVSEFNRRWDGGTSPDIGEFLPPGRERRPVLMALVAADLEHRWRAASRWAASTPSPIHAWEEAPSGLPERPQLEDYAACYPEMDDVAQLPLELIAHEYRVRHQWGDRPAIEEYARRFAHHVATLRRAIEEEGHVPMHSLSETCSTITPTASDTVSAPICAIPGLDASLEQLPSTIGRFRIEGVLGQGSFGTVYLGHDDQLQRPVAIKVPHPHRLSRDGQADAYLAEARTVARLDHPHIVPVYDVGQCDGFPCYIVTKYVAGKTLASENRAANWSWPAAACLVATIADALHYAHLRGLVHRDIKPANILLDKTGEPHLVDFGLALQEWDQSDDSAYIGTPAYMSPEQARGEGHLVDGRSDIYSLGTVLYELLTGRRPFAAASLSGLLHLIATREPRPPRQINDSVPIELERICLKALAKRVQDRYTTARDLAADLRAFSAAADLAGEPRRAAISDVAEFAGIRPATDSVRPHPAAPDSPAASARGGWLEDLAADFWNPAPFLEEKRRGFCGREWVFAELGEWLDTAATERVAIIMGEPGAGKSAVVAEFVGRDQGRRVLACHCCRADTPATLEPWRFVRHLAASVAQRVPAFAEQFQDRHVRESLDIGHCKSDPVTAFEQGLLAPLHRIEPVSGQVGVMVVDALDEAVHHSGLLNLVKLIGPRCEQLPDWLRLVVTTRRDVQVLDELAGCRVFELKTDDGRNQADANLYLEHRLSQPPLTKRLTEAGVKREQAAAVLRERSGGNFLYLRSALDALERGLLRGDQIGTLPPRLYGLYRSFLQRDFPDSESFAEPRIVLELVLAAGTPLTCDELGSATGLNEDQLLRTLHRLSAYLPARTGTDGKVRYAVFHQSLADWLAGGGGKDRLHYVDVLAGHRRLADSGWQAYQRGVDCMSRYELSNLPVHLAAAGRAEAFYELLTDGCYLEAKARAGLVFELTNDLVAAQRLLPADSPRRWLLGLLHEAILRDVHFLEYHPGLLFQCLWNSCWWYDCGEAARHYAGAAPGTSFRDPSVPPLSALLERWRARRALQAQPAPWLRSLRPPAIQLGTSQRAVLRRHKQPVVCVAFSPDGQRIASGSYDGEIRCWDAGNGMEEWWPQGGHERRIVTLAFSPDGKHLVSAALDNRVIVWDAVTREEIVSVTGDMNIVELAGRGRGADSTRMCEIAGEFSVRSAAVAGGDSLTLAIGLREGKLLLWRESQGFEMCESSCDGSIYSLAFSPDGTLLYSASRDKSVGVWDVASGRRLEVCRGHDGWVMQVAVSPDGRHLASASGDRTVRVWDARTGEPLQCLRGHGDTVFAAAFSADGERLVSASGDGTIGIWSLSTGDMIRQLRGHERGVVAVAVCSRSGRIASGGVDCTVRVWDAEFGHEPRRFRSVGSLLRCAAFTPDARQLAVGALGDLVELWNVEQGVPVAVCSGHADEVTAVDISSDGRLLVSGSKDHSVRVWNLDESDTGRRSQRESPAATNQSPDSERIPRSVRELRCYQGHSQSVTSVQFAPDGHTVLSFGDDRRARLWSPHTGEEVAVIVAGEFETWGLVRTSHETRLCSSTPREGIRLWDLATGRVVGLVDMGGYELHDLVFTCDQRYAVGATEDSTVRICTSDDGQLRFELVGHTDLVSSLACGSRVSTAGLIVSGSHDGTVRLWDLESRACLRCFEGHQGWVVAVALAPDGLTTASGSSDKTIRLWDNQTGREKCCLSQHSATVTAVAFSPDGSRLASASRDYRVCLWDPATAELLHVLAGHEGWVNCLRFNASGRILATGSDDNSVRLWDVRSGRQMARLVANTFVESLEFTADERRLLACSRSGVVAEWEFRDSNSMESAAGKMHVVEKVAGADAPRLLRTMRNARKVDGVTLTSDGAYVVGWQGELPIRLWDAKTGQPRVEAESLEHRLTWPGVRTSTAMHAQVDATSTTLIDSTGGPVAWYPAPLQRLTSSRDGTVWVGRDNTHLCLFKLERGQ